MRFSCLFLSGHFDTIFLLMCLNDCLSLSASGFLEALIEGRDSAANPSIAHGWRETAAEISPAALIDGGVE